MNSSRTTIVSSLGIFLFPTLIIAQSKPTPPTIVTVAMYVNRIHNLDIRGESFEADFYLWLDWVGNITAEDYEFINATTINRSNEVLEVDTSGTKFISVRIRGSFVNPMDVSDYPQDKHVLTIIVEDYNWTEDQLRYEVDSANTKMDETRSAGEWKFQFAGAEVGARTVLNSDDRYSSFRFNIEAKRSLSPFVVKILIPIILVVLMSMLTFFIPPMELEAQVGLGATALLTIIALNFVIADELPDVSYLTNADVLLIGSYVIVFLALCESIVTNVLYRKENVALSRQIDRSCRFVFPLLYAIFLLFLFVF